MMLKVIIFSISMVHVLCQMYNRVTELSLEIYDFLYDRNLTNCYKWADDDSLLLKCLRHGEVVDIRVNVIKKIYYI